MHYNSYVYSPLGTRHVFVVLYTKASLCLGVAWYYKWSVFSMSELCELGNKSIVCSIEFIYI